MAVAMEGFSIREYTSRMRSVDVVKCWPFDEANEEVMGAILPPITIKKFSWWFDHKLQLVQDDDDELSDLDTESLQSILRMKRREKGKAKTKATVKAPKKRSIVELFAVAPQVERVNSSDDDEDDENGEESCDEDGEDSSSSVGSDEEDRIPIPKFSTFGKSGLNCRSKRKVKKKGVLSMMKKEKVVMIKDLKKDKVKKNNKLKGEKGAVDPNCTRKKDKTCKVKLQSSGDILTSSNCTTYVKDLFDAFSTHSKKPRLKRLTAERSKCKISTTSNILPNEQQAVLPVRGILKKQNKPVAAENISDSISQDANKLNHCDTQHVYKHVTFSTKDDVLEPNWKACLAVDSESRGHLFSDANITSSAKGQTAEMEKVLFVNETKKTEGERTRCTKDKFTLQQVTEKEVSSMHHVPESNFLLRQHDFSQANLFSAAEPFGQGPVHSESHNRVTLHNKLYTCSADIPKISPEPYIPKLMDSFSRSQRLLDLSGDADPKHNSACSMDFLKAYPRPPASYLSVLHNDLNSQSLFPPQDIRLTHHEPPLSCQWIPHLSPKELMHTICSLPDWNSRACTYGETHMNEDSVGLPLNSLGQFITSNSSGKDGCNHIRSLSPVAGPSLSSVMHNNVLNNQVDGRSCNEMALLKNQHKTYWIKDSNDMIEHCFLPSRIDMIDRCGIGKRNTVIQAFDPYFNSMESVMDRMKVFRIECRSHDQVQRHPGDAILRQHGNPDDISLHVPRSTMRLMGKEFIIGRRGLEGCENKEVWKDEQIIRENCGGNGTESSSSINCQESARFVVHPILGKLRETVTDFSKPKIKQPTESDPQMMVSESKISSQFFDFRNNARNQNDGTLTPEIHHFPLNSSPSPNGYNFRMQESFSSAHISPPECSRTSMPATTLLESSRDDVRLGRKGAEYEQIPLHGSQFALKLPLSDSECGRHIHQPWSQNSFKAVSPYDLDSRQKGTLMEYGHPFSAPDSICYPCSISGINYGTGTSVFSRPEPFNLSSSSSSSQNAFTSASLAYRPSFPVHPGLSKQNGHGSKVLFDNQLKSRFSVRVPSHGKRSKKRFPSASNGSKKSSKIPKIRVEDDCSNAAAEVEAGNNFGGGDIQCSKQILGPSSAQQNEGIVEHEQSEVHKVQLQECTGINSKLNGSPRSGPVKLTAGAKYILKPCQKNDPANVETTNSTSSVVALTYDKEVLE